MGNHPGLPGTRFDLGLDVHPVSAVPSHGNNELVVVSVDSPLEPYDATNATRLEGMCLPTELKILVELCVHHLLGDRSRWYLFFPKLGRYLNRRTAQFGKDCTHRCP